MKRILDRAELSAWLFFDRCVHHAKVTRLEFLGFLIWLALICLIVVMLNLTKIETIKYQACLYINGGNPK